jgi:hypothetical protein
MLDSIQQHSVAMSPSVGISMSSFNKHPIPFSFEQKSSIIFSCSSRTFSMVCKLYRRGSRSSTVFRLTEQLFWRRETASGNSPTKS